MWWRLGVLGGITAALLLLMFVPYPGTLTIKVDLPPSAHPPSGSQVQSVVENGIWIVNTAVVAIILGVSGWVAWRIVRHHRISNADTTRDSANL